jgi:succinate dehydrogenase hydrophobic anchor subunit
MAVRTPSGSGAGSRSRSWQWTAWSGVALLVLVTVHMVANHFVEKQVGGLRTYHQVIEYIGNPWIFSIESIFLVIVTIHAMLGLRSVLFDLGLSASTKRWLNKGLVALGALTIAYGFVLIGVLASRA